MEIGFPFVMLVGPWAAAVVALVLRGRRRAAATVGLIAVVLLALLVALATPGEAAAVNPSGLFGLTLVLTPLARSLFLFIYSAAGLLFILTWFRPAGRSFVPLLLAALSPLAAALMVSPAGIGAVMLMAAAALIAPILYNGQFEAAGAAWRYFLLTTVGLLLLVAALPLAGGQSTAGWLAPLLATLLLLGGFPGHVWLVGLSRRASPVVLAFALCLAQLVVVVYLLTVLDAIPAVRSSATFGAAMRWGAVLTALAAVFMMSRARNLQELIAAALLLDAGFLLLAPLAPGADGLLIAIPALISRFLALALLAAALGGPAVLSSPTAKAGGTSRAARWRQAIRPVALLVGCLSLLGLPLTPGFASRWAQLALAAQAGVAPATVLTAALGLAVWVILRRAYALREAEHGREDTSAAGGELILTLLLGLVVLLGLFPDLLTAMVARMMGIA